MIIDFHTHLFPEQIRTARENFFDNEPAFKLLYDMPTSKLVGVDTLINTMDEQEVDFSAVFGFPWDQRRYRPAEQRLYPGSGEPLS